MRKYAPAVIVAAVVAACLAANAATPHLYANLVGPLLAKGWHLLLFVALWAAAYVAGLAFFRVLAARPAPPELATAAGVVLFSLAALALAAVHLAFGWLVKAVIVLILLAGGVYGWRRRPSTAGRIRAWLASLEPQTAFLLAFAAMFATPYIVAAAEPPVFWDALTYHLAVPRFYADAHGFVYLPYNVYASMPLGATMYYLGAMLWDGYTCANASYLAVSLLAVAATYRLARIWLGQLYAAVAAFLVLFTPAFFVVLPGAHVDHFVVLYLAAALFFYFRESRGGLEPRRRWLIGFFLGAALAVKYTSVYALAALAPVAIYDRARRRLSFKDVAAILVVAFAFIAPWLVKAFVERGNPVFPLCYGVFGGRDFSAAQAERLIAWQYHMGAGRGWFDYVLLPLRISVSADFDYPSFAGVYLPFLLPLALAAAFVFRRAGRLVVFGWAFLAAWALGPQQLRFLDGALPAFAVTAAGVLAWAGEKMARRARAAWRWALAAVLALAAVAFNAGGVQDGLEGFDYLAGTSRDEFLRSRCGFYAAQEFINDELPADVSVLMVFTNHTLYLKKDAVYDSFFEASPFLMAAERGSPAALYDLAKRRRISHVHVFHYYEKRAWESYAPAAKEIFYEFIRDYCRPVYRDPLNDVYELKEAD